MGHDCHYFLLENEGGAFLSVTYSTLPRLTLVNKALFVI